ncbi:unnamed protein product [Spirodela intermedia]|uniref:Uncharacterized protein n=1 Tax=Spirodela intermedia TaxID=51605 RepID=A0A7I8L5T3_SPIIN|nr:unnamed protein product [Spirodela intermedia]
MNPKSRRDKNITKLIKKIGHFLVDSRVEDSESIDSKTGFFSKIGASWIQANILFILCVTVRGDALNPRTT